MKTLLLLLLVFNSALYSQSVEEFQPSNATVRPEDPIAEPFPVGGLQEFGASAHLGHYFLLPFCDQLLPGIGELYYGQYSKSLGFAGGVIASSMLISRSKITQVDIETLSKESIENGTNPFLTKDTNLRMYLTGLKLSGTLGSLSSYNSFRTAVRMNPKYGDFSFLSHEESISDLLYAPLRFDFLKRSSTWGTLGLATLGFLLAAPKGITGADTLYVGSTSLMAGVGEEAMFRGWLLPLAHHYTGNYWAANIMQSALFWGAHSPRSPFHFFAGLWFGHLTQKNSWTLSEAVFVHTWWDVLALGSSLITSKMNPSQEPVSIQIDLPTIIF